jgi:hypothetical protein
MDFFFYGTLMDPEVLARVLGRPIVSLRRELATLDGYRRVYRQNATYPILIAAPGRRVDGLIVRGLTAADRKRLMAFEGNSYRLVALTVEGRRSGLIDAWTFLPIPEIVASTEPWTLASWRLRHKRTYLRQISDHGTPG